ncbi:MAG: hypothetical protein NC821_06515 [Candidatus Omnitrophica bacterium]|nr:hypothetical protein [Candidatus Omnitrophota bacterium]
MDEIGKMEFFSEKFRKIVFEAFNSSKHVLGVVHKDMRNLFASREDTEVLEVELNNHQDILKRCRILLKGEKN